MLEFTEGKRPEPGEWRGVKREDGKRTAYLTCPQCKKWAGLWDHTIGHDGIVSPSVVCPTEGCWFHEMVKLVGWK